MRGLYSSIIITVLGSLFFIGWGLDELVEYSTEDKVTETQGTTIYRHLVDGLTNELSTLDNSLLSKRVSQFQQDYQIETSLASSKKIALPSSLIAQLNQQGGLLLASSTNQYLLKNIPQHPEFLLRLELPAEAIVDDNFNFILTLILYVSICVILILWLFPLTRRLYLLNNAAAKIGSGQLDARIANSRFSYIKMLERSFNTMASKIEQLVADNKVLARSLSHDIRTPMACLRFGIEAALDSQSIEKKNSYLTRMDNELTRMEEMTSIFLDYASMERQALKLNKTQTNITALITSAIDDCQVLAEQKNITVHLSGDNTISYPLDYHWSYRALVNLISNAIGYANSEVLLTINDNNQLLTITVEDDGKGIADDKLAVIFTPFVKLDADRSREQGHFGLGLAICSKVMDWHQGSINACNKNQLKGACFTLDFPK
ncbi:sensor histidine kinase [Colwellia psychrerythraea]|uniref:histidine kinase n=1 Tax=Colwellia psychrerythraea TaxID=28229 RepID=A0A099KZ98_COLPS|nr:ATP-binding protein [Colwellia psychrerythraea]KGJ94973.1 integral membrane sensor signal transduction histidine kinase [Colwellia psychrerythraea]